jgi:hypothetical protein
MIDEILLKVEDDSDEEDESNIFKYPPLSLLITTFAMMQCWTTWENVVLEQL